MQIVQRTQIHVRRSSGPSFAEPELPIEDATATYLEPTPLEERASTGDKERQDPVQTLKGDSREAFILALYDEYRPRLYRYMQSMQLGRDHADEVIQETFMRLTMELLKENKIENVQGWIVRVAHNLAINVLKKERGTVVNDEARSFVMENRADPALSPEETYANKEQFKLMRTVLSSLKPQHRQCFQMRAQGFPYKDIGLALGFSEQRAAFVVKQVAVRLAAVYGLRNGGQGDR
ncbi:MAG TPA: sigma-70 family RNA polymerase sigma factor [Granulicella sp.]|jgi:RNA polymerase sigma-70 factor (ECF subfamily)